MAGDAAEPSWLGPIPCVVTTARAVPPAVNPMASAAALYTPVFESPLKDHVGAVALPLGTSNTSVLVTAVVEMSKRSVPPVVTPQSSAPTLYAPVFESPLKLRAGAVAEPLALRCGNVDVTAVVEMSKRSVPPVVMPQSSAPTL